jgi:hypothetical protein
VQRLRHDWIVGGHDAEQQVLGANEVMSEPAGLVLSDNKH